MINDTIAFRLAVYYFLSDNPHTRFIDLFEYNKSGEYCVKKKFVDIIDNYILLVKQENINL